MWRWAPTRLSLPAAQWCLGAPARPRCWLGGCSGPNPHCDLLTSDAEVHTQLQPQNQNAESDILFCGILCDGHYAPQTGKTDHGHSWYLFEPRTYGSYTSGIWTPLCLLVWHEHCCVVVTFDEAVIVLRHELGRMFNGCHKVYCWLIFSQCFPWLLFFLNCRNCIIIDASV